MHKTTLWLVVLASITIVLPTAFMSFTLGGLVIFWVISANYKDKFQQVVNNPAALATLALFFLYALGTLYSSTTWEISLTFLMKYQKLLIVPLIISVMHTEKFREYSLNAFLFSMIAIMILSYLKWLGLLPHQDINQGFVVFKGHIAHNIFMSFAMYLMMLNAIKTTGTARLTWITLSTLAAFNILFLVDGRTGQITMGVLIVWFTYEIWGAKSIKYWIGLTLLGLLLIQISPYHPHSRLIDVKQEIASHQVNGTQTSAGERLEMYKNTLSLIQKNPIFGGGTGSLGNEYSSLVKNKDITMQRVTNCHNQFLLTTQELGITGLIMLVIMWSLQWNASYHMHEFRNSYALRGLLLTIITGSLFNSLILDSSEGKFFCILVGVLLSSYRPEPAEVKTILE